MTKVMNLVAILWEYKNKDGEMKKNYHTIWKLITKDDGNQFIKLDVIPTNWEWYASVYEIKQKDDKTENLPF